jgi:hypothetical protein
MISTVSSGPGTKRAGQRGQISIFFASSLIILISVIAFVINIGLFVKAKINLQNATDAAAYAGAAVQARMLNKVGYLNWDMRNVFKEWMFKYYVLGNLNIDGVMTPAGGNTVSFRMQPDPNIPDAARAADIYNFPSVCLHFAGIKTNVCKKYGIPGIPRFEPTNLVGIDETTSSFIDGIVSAKTEDCSKRSRLNFNVTNMWAYQVMDNTEGSAFADAPQVVQNRPGAWPKAVELAIRVRSVERAINRPPIVGGICAPGSNPAGACAQRTTQLENEPHYGNERPLKAFWSGFRNLGNESDSEMKNSFTLTELSPTPVTFPKVNDLSTMLIRSELRNEPKHYVDLKLQMVNYATFFTALISRTGEVQAGGTRVTAQGACDVAKVAVPVPGYPLGFFKNPEVLTYYAVKGEANFQGLFNPFAGNGVKMTAWAAAKPMGGRIGPALFQSKPSDTSVVVSRTTSTKRRSTSYVSGLNLTNVPRKTGAGTVPLGEYSPGMPVPINNGSDLTQRFWVGAVDDVLGGWASNSTEIVFGIPNLAYDFVGSDFTSAKHDLNSEKTIIINPTAAEGTYAAGLYRSDQFRPFRANLTEVTVDGVAKAVDRVRAPTRYEAANYTIPTPSALHVTEKIGDGFSDNFGGLAGRPITDRTNVQQLTFYAPLYSTNLDAAYRNQADVVKAFRDFMLAQQPAMEKYLRTMNQVAYKIYSDKPDLYAEAARRISDFDFTTPPTASGTPASPRSCQSIAGQFLFYYFGAGGPLTPPPANCPKPLIESLEKFISDISGPTSTISDAFHRMEYSFPGNSITKYPQMLTGYMPGPLRGVSNIGVLSLPFNNDFKETMRRSGYSTKFVTLKSLTASGGYAPGSGTLAIYSEDRIAPLSEDIVPKTFRNALSATALPGTVTH